MKKMVVEIRNNRSMGFLTIDPVNKRYLKQCQRRIIENHKAGCPDMHQGWRKEETERWLRDGSCALLQRQDAIDTTLDELMLSDAERNDLENGWSVRKRTTVEFFEHIFACANDMPSYH